MAPLSDIFWGTIFFVLGLIFGSFANVCIWRLPRGEEVVRTPSHCPECGAAIRWFDNIPVISYLWLKGRCRQCRRSISLRYPLVELSTALVFLALYLHYGLSLELVMALPFGWALLVLSAIDLEHYILPDVITLPGIILGLVGAGLASLDLPLFLEPISGQGCGWPPIAESLAGLLLGGGFLWFSAWAGRLVFRQEAMGGGDIKLAAMIGAFLGLRGLLVALFAAFLTGSLSGLGLILSGKLKPRKSILPFGPFLALGALIAVFLGRPLVEWYLGLLMGHQ